MPDYNIENMKILVVEQNALFAEAISTLLRELGVRDILIATTIEDAYDIFKSEPLDLVFCDWSPGLDALHFMHMVRNHQSDTNPFVPVIVLSAYSDLDQLKQAVNAGISDFLTKPLNPRKVYQRIKKAIESPTFFVRSGVYFGPCRRHVGIFDDDQYGLDQTGSDDPGKERRIREISIKDDGMRYMR